MLRRGLKSLKTVGMLHCGFGFLFMFPLFSSRIYGTCMCINAHRESIVSWEERGGTNRESGILIFF